MKKLYIVLIVLLIPCLIFNIIEKDIQWILNDMIIISMNLHSIQMEELKENRVMNVFVIEGGIDEQETIQKESKENCR